MWKIPYFLGAIEARLFVFWPVTLFMIAIGFMVVRKRHVALSAAAVTALVVVASFAGMTPKPPSSLSVASQFVACLLAGALGFGLKSLLGRMRPKQS